jgi:hypothetical protein
MNPESGVELVKRILLLARRDGADLNVYAAHTNGQDDTITIHVGDERAAQAVRALYPGVTIVEE